MRNAPLTIDTTHLEAVDSRMISTMRLVLAFSALMIIYLDPSEPDRLVPITYTALILYTLYSLVLLILALRESALMQAMKKVAHWFDIAWYLILIALSSGTSSIFFFLFFFSILVASFRGGFSSGLKAVVVSSVLFTIIGFATAPAAPQFELNRFLLRPIYMLALGYMIAYWGGHEITLKRRLALLKEVTSLSNPRFGVDRTVGVILEGARAFYDANSCALVMNDVDASRHLLWRADMHNSEGWPRPTQLLMRWLARCSRFRRSTLPFITREAGAGFPPMLNISLMTSDKTSAGLRAKRLARRSQPCLTQNRSSPFRCD